MDYDTLIDAETWAFIRKTEEHFPPETTRLSIAEQREIYDHMCRAFFAGYPDGISVRDDMVGEIPLRIYEPDQPDGTVTFFHGGGFVVGGLDSHDDVCAEICQRTGLRVVSADYRLCPEHPHPAAFEDAWEVAQYVSRTWPGVIVLAGDSAGGNLAAAVAHKARGHIEIAGQVLVYPGLGGDIEQGSYLRHANAPMLTLDDVKFYMSVRYGGADGPVDPTSAPLSDSDFSGLPSTVVITAQCDPLSDDGGAYRDRILAAGGKAHWIEEPGLVHGYLRGRSSVTRARHSFDRIIHAIRALASGNWPF